VSAARFHPAEAEHQGYCRRNTAQPYCLVVIASKGAKACRRFLEMLAR
jgi:peptide-methionine (S)-S-oxide reductase